MSEHGELVNLSLIRRPEVTGRLSVNCDHRTVTIWKVMKGTILEIMTHEPSREVITDAVYNAVRLPLIKNSDFIYADLYGLLEQIVESIAESLLDNPDSEMLRNLLEAWDKFRFSLSLVSQLFPILDGVVARETDCSFANVGRTIFESGIFRDGATGAGVTTQLLRMAEDERRGVPVDRSLFRHACSTLRFLSVRDSRRYAAFEKRFLEESGVHFRRLCQQLLSTGDTVEYLARAERALHVEERRLAFCLQGAAARAALLLAEGELVRRRLHDLLALESNGVADLLAEGRTEDLALLYRVVRRAPAGRAAIAHHVAQHLEGLTRRLLQDVQFLTADSVVEAVLQVQDQVDALVGRSFSDDKYLKGACCSAFRKYVTCDERLALFLAQHADAVLSGRSRDREVDADAKMARVLRVTALLRCKDAVRGLHKVYLGARLLRRGAGVGGEELLAVSGLQAVLRTSLLDVRGMIKDLRRSDVLTDVFQRHPKVVKPKGGAPACEFSIQLLSAAFWPLTPPPLTSRLVLPPRPAGHLVNFESFYRALASARRLLLLPQYGTAELLVFEEERRRHASKVSFAYFSSAVSVPSALSCPLPPLVKTVVCRLLVTTLQMSLLWLFNDAERLTAADMARLACVDVALVLRALEPLVARRVLVADRTYYRVSRALGKGAKFANLVDEGSYCGLPTTPTPGDAHAVARKLNTDAVILRVAKARGVLSHDTLVADTVRILRDSVFLPTSLYVTRRIDALLRRNMLRRRPEHSDVYSYK